MKVYLVTYEDYRGERGVEAAYTTCAAAEEHCERVRGVRNRLGYKVKTWEPWDVCFPSRFTKTGRLRSKFLGQFDLEDWS